jgi:hypothetical protein
MLLSKGIHTRQSIDIPFYRFDEAYNTYFRATFGKSTGKIINWVKIMDASKLVMTIHILWRDQDTYDQFISDEPSIINYNLMDEYNLANGISFERQLFPM